MIYHCICVFSTSAYKPGSELFLACGAQEHHADRCINGGPGSSLYGFLITGKQIFMSLMSLTARL